MEKRYRVTLLEEERQELQSMVSAGKAEAHLVATACGAPPEGRARWTLRLLADRMVGLGYVESVCHEAVRQTQKK